MIVRLCWKSFCSVLMSSICHGPGSLTNQVPSRKRVMKAKLSVNREI